MEEFTRQEWSEHLEVTWARHIMEFKEEPRRSSKIQGPACP